MLRNKQKGHEIYPDEIFLDARNLPEFDTHQMQGRLERPITKRAVFLVAILFLALGGVALGRAAYLQIERGNYYGQRAASNHLRHVPIFAERGVIYDRNEEQLVRNNRREGDAFARRSYTEREGLAHVLGYVSYPKKDAQGVYYQMEIQGKEGVEKAYDDELKGTGGVVIKEVDVHGNAQTQNVIVDSVDGANITLAIDAALQEKLFRSIRGLANAVDFQGGSGVVLDVQSGEVLALTSFPEFDSEVMSAGEPEYRVRELVGDSRKPFLNRAIAGRYTPGSSVKPFFALAALEEHVIDPLKQIYSSGEIAVPHPYDDTKETVFKDWKAHGWVDMREALAVSSNIYFYAVGGGLPHEAEIESNYHGEEALGIAGLEEYARMFRFDERTGIDLPGEEGGVIPSPKWKAEHFDGDSWRIGDTYNTAIGQYGFQITPIELARAVATIANAGVLIKPHIVMRVEEAPALHEGSTAGALDFDPENFKVVREGMRRGVTDGIAQALSVYGVDVAAKTGTAEVGTAKKRAHSWVSGFFPYESPRYAFAVVMGKGPRDNLRGAVFVMREVLEWMVEERPEYVRDG